MPKPRGGVFRAATRDTRYEAVIVAHSPPNVAWNTPNVTPVIATDEQALDVQRGIYRSARHAGITAYGVETTCHGCRARLGGEHKARCQLPGWVVAFKLTTKADGRRAIVAQVKAGKALAYNLRR